MEEKLTEKGLKASHQSIWLYLKSQGYRSTDLIEVKVLSNKHKNDRLNWWEANKDTDWEKVVFTDETDFRLGSMKTKRWIKKDQRNTTSIMKLSKKVNAWAAILYNGKSSIKTFTQNMDSEFYVGILMEKLSEIKEIGREDMMFQCDNDSKHVIKMAMDIYKKNKLKKMEWPSNSPDLNPIENVWTLMKRKINKHETKKISELIELVDTTWDEIDQEVIQNCIESMASRVAECIKLKGDRIRY